MNEQPQPPQMPYQPAPPQGPPTPPQQYGQPQQQLTPPQPMPGPQPPMPGQAPMQPMMQQPMPPYQMPPKRVNKGLLWGIIGGVVGLILIIVAIVVSLIMFSGPSENDYMEAQKVLDEAHTAYSDISDKTYTLFSSSTMNAKGTDNSSTIDSLKKSKKTLDEKFEKLSKMKAITGDKKVKEKWDKLNAKRDKFNKMIDFSIELGEKVLPAFFKALQLDSFSTVSDINRAITDIDNISTSDADTKQMMTEAANYLRAARDYANAKSSSSYSYDSSAYDKYMDAADKFEAAHKKWTNSVDKRTDEAQIKDEVNDLIEALSHKGKDS